MNGAHYARRPLHEITADWAARNQLPVEDRQCACGGIVTAAPGNPGPGVQAHQQTEQHRRWAEKEYRR